MPPKNKFSKKQITTAAFEIARLEGIENITIRKVANQLGSSIAPIYVNFTDVDELKREVVKKIVKLSHRLLIEQDSGNPFHDIGVASLRFAKEYNVLFRDFIMNQKDYLENYDQEMGNDLLAHMHKDEKLVGFTDEELMMILLKMRIFSVGLSVMVANGLLPESYSEEKEIELLDSTAMELITAARIQKKRGNESYAK